MPKNRNLITIKSVDLTQLTVTWFCYCSICTEPNPTMFEVLDQKRVTYDLYDFLAVKVRIPENETCPSGDCCLEYQNLCQYLGPFKPTGCSRPHITEAMTDYQRYKYFINIIFIIIILFCIHFSIHFITSWFSSQWNAQVERVKISHLHRISNFICIFNIFWGLDVNPHTTLISTSKTSWDATHRRKSKQLQMLLSGAVLWTGTVSERPFVLQRNVQTNWAPRLATKG